MSDCERLSDRMPEVAMQQAAWTAEEAAHLASCADCRAEWDLVLAARRLESSAPSVDPTAVAAAVQRRLATDRIDLKVAETWQMPDIGDDTLVGSLWRTLAGRPFVAHVRFGEPQAADGRDRRAWSRDLEETVRSLRESMASPP